MRCVFALLFLVAGCDGGPSVAEAPAPEPDRAHAAAHLAVPARAPQAPPAVRCAYALTSPWLISGAVLETEAPDACQVEISTADVWLGVTDKPGHDWAIIDFDRRAHHVGETFAPEVVSIGPDPVYSVFDGTVTWLADAPDWRVSFDLTGVGPEPIRLVGVMFGHADAVQ